jgi:hypothetical protein
MNTAFLQRTIGLFYFSSCLLTADDSLVRKTNPKQTEKSEAVNQIASARVGNIHGLLGTGVQYKKKFVRVF